MEKILIEKIDTILEQGLKIDWGTQLTITLINLAVVLIAIYMINYLAEKGKNNATKDDIEDITKKIETTKIEYSKMLDDYYFKNKLKLAALEKRLEAYQESYVLWLKLRRSNFGHEEIGIKIGNECREWWEKNCLYLDKETSEAFYQAFVAAQIHSELVAGKASKEEAKENREIIRNFGKVLARNLEMPAISENIEKED